MEIDTIAVKRVSQILLLFLFAGCQDLDKALEEKLTVSSTNEMYQLELTISNNVTDIYTPIAFEVTVSRLAIETDTVTVVTPEPVAVSEQNGFYHLEMTLESGATDVNTPIDFTVDVTRTAEYVVRSDSKVIGIWGLYYMTVDDNVQNVDQFPTDYESTMTTHSPRLRRTLFQGRPPTRVARGSTTRCRPPPASSLLP